MFKLILNLIYIFVLFSLLLFSVISAMQEKYDISETFLEKVTTQDTENIIGWTLLAFLYEQKGQELNAEITMKKTLKINQNLLNETNLNASINQLTNDIDLEASMIKKDEGIFLFNFCIIYLI